MQQNIDPGLVLAVWLQKEMELAALKTQLAQARKVIEDQALRLQEGADPADVDRLD